MGNTVWIQPRHDYRADWYLDAQIIEDNSSADARQILFLTNKDRMIIIAADRGKQSIHGHIDLLISLR